MIIILREHPSTGIYSAVSEFFIPLLSLARFLSSSPRNLYVEIKRKQYMKTSCGCEVGIRKWKREGRQGKRSVQAEKWKTLLEKGWNIPRGTRRACAPLREIAIPATCWQLCRATLRLSIRPILRMSLWFSYSSTFHFSLSSPNLYQVNNVFNIYQAPTRSHSYWCKRKICNHDRKREDSGKNSFFRKRWMQRSYISFTSYSHLQSASGLQTDCTWTRTCSMHGAMPVVLGHPSKRAIFIINRVTMIQKLVSKEPLVLYNYAWKPGFCHTKCVARRSN